jgi:hypothetical protein
MYYSTVSLTEVATDNPQIDRFVWITALEEIVRSHDFIEFFTPWIWKFLKEAVWSMLPTKTKVFIRHKFCYQASSFKSQKAPVVFVVCPAFRLSACTIASLSERIFLKYLGILLKICQKDEKWRQCMYNVILRRFGWTIVAVEKQ